MLHRTCLAGVVLLAAVMGACDTTSPSGASPLQTILGGSPPAPPTPGNGINGRYRGDFTFTEMDRTSCGQHCWPTHFTVVANLRQNGDGVTGDFDVREVRYSSGDVEGTVDTATGFDMLGTFRARFLPNDLGVPIAIDTKITSPDGGHFEGTFVFGWREVGRGSASFTRLG